MKPHKAARPNSREDFEIAVVCATDLEYNAVCLMVDDFWDKDGDPYGRAIGDLNIYTTGYMGGFNVVVLLCNSGKATAAGTVASLRSSYPCIKLLLLTGICDGVPNANGEELLLGDVVISDTVIQYDLGRRYPDGFREKNILEDRLGRPDKSVRNLIAILKTDMALQRLEEKVSSYLSKMQDRVSRDRRCKATYQYPGPISDMLFEPTYCHRHHLSLQCICGDYAEAGDPVCGKSRKTPCEQTGCDKGFLLPRKRLDYKKKLKDDGDIKAAQQPSIFIGKFGCGDTSFNAAADRDRIAQKHNIIAFETEGGGVWDELSCIIVKGVSTYGDGHKMENLEDWKHFAAATAASTARGLIDRYPQTDKSPLAEFKNQANIAFMGQADKTCLKDLYITSPPDDKIRIEQTKGGLLLDAYAWILDNEVYQQWSEDSKKRLLWIRSDPGKGKTMLLCGIINQMQEASRNLCFFFCQATDSRLNNTSSVLRGLLHMLISKQLSLISYIRSEYDKSGKSMFEDSNAWVVLSRIFLNILGDPSVRDFTFVIDALDECLTDLPELIELIRQSSLSYQVKWLISSRNETSIQDVLMQAKNQSTVSLELNAESVSGAIEYYIHHHVNLLSEKKRYKQVMRDSIQEYLTNNADGTFLWVALVCKLLEKAPSFDLDPRLAKYPPGLDNLYKRMIKKVCRGELDWGRRVLAISTVARRPLSIQELETLTPLPSITNNTIASLEKRWEEVLGYCGSFLTMRKGIVYFIHQSAKDFILNKATDRLFRDGMEYINKEIFKRSVSAILATLKRDIYGLVKHGFLIDNLSDQNVPNPDPLAPVGYCCIYWIDHFEDSISQTSDNESQKLIDIFFREKFINWLEALSLLRSVFQGQMAMQKLERLLTDTKISELSKRVWDARRFIQMFGKAIEDFFLQVYISALLFSPVESITRKQFEAEAPNWVRLWSNNVTDWTSCIQKFEGLYLTDYKHLSISSSGNWLAADGDSGGIAIWEVETGKRLRNLQSPDPRKSFSTLNNDKLAEEEGKSNSIMRAMLNMRSSQSKWAFSPQNDNELAVIDSGWEKLMIWDIFTGQIIRQIELPGARIFYGVSFLPSALGFLGIAFYNYDNTHVATWNTQKDEELNSSALPSKRKFEKIAFSPVNSHVLATSEKTSSGYRINIYDIDTDHTIHNLNFDWIDEIAFSMDGKCLAAFIEPINSSVRAEYTPIAGVEHAKFVILIDASTGKIPKEIRLTSVPRGEPAFSADGQLLAVGTDGWVKIWNVRSGQCLQKTKVAAHYVVFSPEANKLFCGSRGAINVVEVGHREMPSPDPDPCDQGKVALSISPRGKMIASWNNSTLKIRNTNSRALMHRVRDAYKKGSDARAQFAPDSTKMALASENSLKVWDICSKRKKADLGYKRFCFE